jgi:acetylglutamate kinase
MQPMVIKIGGNEIDDPTFLFNLAPAIKSLDAPIIVVHGGGREISSLQKLMGIEPRYLDGVRVTDAPSLSVSKWCCVAWSINASCVICWPAAWTRLA